MEFFYQNQNKTMTKLTNDQMLTLEGGLVAPGPGEAERCRAMAIVSFVHEFGGIGQYGLTAQDFVCFF
jgi:hypothetical protein